MPSALSRIMCVEDDPDIRELLQVALEDLGGLEVKLVDNAEDGIDEIVDYAPQILLLDVMLPGLSGPEALPEFRRLTEPLGTRIIFLTAKASERARQEFIALGADEVMFKPFEPMSLADELAALWDGWAA